jgi:hypothetical protein
MWSKDVKRESCGEEDCQRNLEDVRPGLGRIEGEGRTDGIESNQVSNTDSSRGNSLGERNTDRGQADPGGITRRLRELQKAYTSHIDSAHKKLEACLNENESLRGKIVAEMEQLESLLLSALGDEEDQE